MPGESAGPASAAPAGKYQPPRIRKRITMRSLLRDREFLILTITEFFSLAGDQLARVALTVLVFDRTNSALQAAVTYALTFIPAAIGGPLLSGLADRRPRRSVMIAADLVRAPLIGLLADPVAAACRLRSSYWRSPGSSKHLSLPLAAPLFLTSWPASATRPAWPSPRSSIRPHRSEASAWQACYSSSGHRRFCS